MGAACRVSVRQSEKVLLFMPITENGRGSRTELFRLSAGLFSSGRLQQQHDRADDEQAVGDVEGGPVERAELKVQEVTNGERGAWFTGKGDAVQSQSIVEVTQSTTGDKGEGDGEPETLGGTAEEQPVVNGGKGQYADGCKPECEPLSHSPEGTFVEAGVDFEPQPGGIDEPAGGFEDPSEAVEDVGLAAEVKQCPDGGQQDVAGESISWIGGLQRRFSFSRSHSMQFRV